MTVNDFVRAYSGTYTINYILYDIDTEEEVEMSADDLYYYTDDNSEWKNAEVENWNIIDNLTIRLSVIKED